jgi:hypothetical protein
MIGEMMRHTTRRRSSARRMVQMPLARAAATFGVGGGKIERLRQTVCGADARGARFGGVFDRRRLEGAEGGENLAGDGDGKVRERLHDSDCRLM